MADLSHALREHFGFDAFKPGQKEVMEHLLAGRSAAAVFPTGGGKSLCYQLPALLMEGVTLVVSPLIALMKDQIDALQARGIEARRLDSSLSFDEYREVMDKVRTNEIRLLYVSPERFNNERFRAAMQGVRISMFAIDEAHCVSEWGHNFRPDYLKLPGYAKAFEAERTLALTATATSKVLDDMCREFEIDPACAVRNQFYRPNLTLLTRPVAVDERDEVLLAAMREHPPGPSIVYVTLQRTAEEVAARLAGAGLPARAYHAGMDNDVRHEVQEWFLESDDGIIVATIAFGMGIDKADIRAVYHYNLPKSLENYSQEIGRSGRDGNPSTCLTLACPDDLNVLENFIYGDTPDESALAGLVAELFSLGEEFDVSYHQLSSAHDVRVLVLRTLMTYLELDGYLVGGTPFYSSYQFKPLMSSAEMLGQFDENRRRFLKSVLARAVPARTWYTLDIDAAADALGEPRDRIVKALDYLGEQGMLELKIAGVRHRYRVERMPPDLDGLTAELVERVHRREQAELRRLRQVTGFIETDGCQVSALNAHFQDPLPEPCGHCSWCLGGGAPTRVPARVSPPMDEQVWEKAARLREEMPEVLSSPRSVARLLCGVSSPALSKAKLHGSELFGMLSHISFQEVLARAVKA